MPAETHLGKDPVTRDEIVGIVREYLAEILDIDPDQIAEEHSFTDDLDADSLSLIELAEALEEEFADRTAGFSIDDDDLEDLTTVGDAVNYVQQRLD